MNEEIKKYWEDKYGTIYFDGSTYFQYVDRTGLTRASVHPNGITYYYYGARTEQEMLKMIKLISFV